MIINNYYNSESNSVTNPFYINISHSRLSAVIEITNPNYKINFNVKNSIGTTLGFEKEIVSFGYNKASKIVDIMNINSILINFDLIHGSYVDGVKGHAIHSFLPWRWTWL